MPTNITDSSAFTDPIQGVADADAQAAASYNLGFQGLANRTRYLKGLVDVHEDLLFPSVDRGVFVPASRADSTGASRSWKPTTAGFAECVDPAEWLVWSFAAGDNLPMECTVNTVRVFFKPGIARISPNKMEAELVRINDNFTTTTIGILTEDNGSATNQSITFSPGVLLVGANTSVYPPGVALGLALRLHGGIGGSGDLAYMCEVRYSLSIL